MEKLSNVQSTIHTPLPFNPIHRSVVNASCKTLGPKSSLLSHSLCMQSFKVHKNTPVKDVRVSFQSSHPMLPTPSLDIPKNRWKGGYTPEFDPRFHFLGERVGSRDENLYYVNIICLYWWCHASKPVQGFCVSFPHHFSQIKKYILTFD